MQQLQQPQKQGLKLKKKKTGFVAFLQRFVVAAQRKMWEVQM